MWVRIPSGALILTLNFIILLFIVDDTDFLLFTDYELVKLK